MALRGGAAAALGVALAQPWSAPALANCQPPAANGATVTCTGNDSTGVGNGTQSNVTVNVLGGASITLGNGATDINLNANNLITNNGTLTTGDTGAGIAMKGTGNTVTNAATGSITAGNNAFGISLANTVDTNTINNAGAITVGNASNGIAVLAPGVAFITFNNSGTITGGVGSNAVNLGILSTITNTGTLRTGNDGIGINLVGLDTVTNAGQITVGNAIAGNAAGINVSNGGNTITNTSTGTITVGNASAGGTAIGINVGSNNTITNAGRLTVGDTAVGGFFASGIVAADNNTILNSGTLTTGADSIGILAANNNIITNQGTIAIGFGGVAISPTGGGNAVTNNGAITSSAAFATGVEAIGDNNRIANSGTIVLGNSSQGIFVFGNNTTVMNAGTVRATTAIAAAGGIATVTNTGTLDGSVNLQTAGSLFTNSGLMTNSGPGAGATDAVAGTFTQTTSGALDLRVAPQAFQRDRLTSTTANLAGTLAALVQPGLYASSTTYQGVVTAANPITTRFDRTAAFAAGTTTPLAFFTASATYNPTTVDLTLTRLGFGAVGGETQNQQAVGAGLDAAFSTTLTGNARTFFTNLLQSTSVGVLDQLSGEGTSGTQETAFSAASLFLSVMGDQTNGFLRGEAPVGGMTALQYGSAMAQQPVFKAMPARAVAPVWHAWAAGFGGSQRLDGDPVIGSHDLTHDTAGGAAGIDYRIGNWLFGAAAGGSTSNFSVPGLATSGHLDGGHLGVYGATQWGQAYASGTLGYAHFDNSTTRTIAALGSSETAQGRFGSDLFGGRFELGWRERFGAYTVTPFAALQFAELWQQGYTETSTTAAGAPGIMGLSFASKAVSSLPLFLGLQADTNMTLWNGMTWLPTARVSWVHEFEPTRDVSAIFLTLPTAAFTVEGPRAARDAARVDLGSKLFLNERVALFGNFIGEFSGRSQTLAGTGGIRVSW
jgi:uncharacterized protein with beta-barrel porin domain